MANEISISGSIAAVKGGVDVSSSVSFTQTMSGEDMIDATQLIPTTNTAVSIGDITSPAAYILIKNLDSTNFVDLATDPNFVSNTIFAHLLPGQIALFPPKASVYARADTANCRIAKTAVEA